MWFFATVSYNNIAEGRKDTNDITKWQKTNIIKKKKNHQNKIP